MPQTYIIVPQEGDTPGYLSHYDNQGIPVGDPITGYLGGFSSWNISGSAVYDTNNPFDPIRFDPSKSNFVQIGDDGSFRIQIGTSINNINRSVSSHIEYGVAGSVDITLADGSVLSVPLDFAGTQPMGKRWAVYEDMYGNERLAEVQGNKTLSELNSTYDIYTRWATSYEVIAQSIAGKLVTSIASKDPQKKDLFQRVLDAMGISEAEFSSDASGSVQGWVQANQFNLEGASRYSFGPTGEKVGTP